jgi:oligosaccharyltransferase complex subunit delta (ribophorin II)
MTRIWRHWSGHDTVHGEHVEGTDLNVQAWPSDGAAALYSLAFHGGIGCILVLYTVFWLRLTLMETLLPLALLAVFTFLSGYKTLLHHVKTDKKKD